MRGVTGYFANFEAAFSTINEGANNFITVLTTADLVRGMH
jgi:hypothetical protein